MKRVALAGTMLCVLSTPVMAQKATAVGVGTGIANSSSKSTAVAVSGQGGAGGAGGTGVGVGTGGNVTIQGTPSGTVTTQNIVTSGTSTVRNVPSVFAPGLSAAGLETCLGSVSGGGAFVGTGFSFGSTIPDAGCAARLDARTLWSMGLKKAAVARLCLQPDIWRSMPDVCGAYVPGSGYGAPGYPAPVVAPVRYAATTSEYTGGPILLVEGKTGKERMCNDYDAPGQTCRSWAGVVSHTPKKLAAKPKPKVDGATQVTAVQPPADAGNQVKDDSK